MLRFFATGEDLRPLFAAIETSLDLQYVECGLFDQECRPFFSSLSGLPGLGNAKTGDANGEAAYLVSLATAIVKVRIVPQRRGGTKYAVDQLVNPATIVVRPGGQYSDSALIGGMVGTIHKDPTAKGLYKAFSVKIRKNFTSVRGNWVGAFALRILESGGRLTDSISFPREYDLRPKAPLISPD
jgi:hypothetical protein